MKNIKIFIASSSELKDLRLQFTENILTKNMYLNPSSINLEIIKWENLDGSIASNGKQNEYNLKIDECDFFVAVFKTKAGEFTIQELEYAHARFLEYNKPKIFTYFIDTQEKEDSLRQLVSYLKKINHYRSGANNNDDFLLKFLDQLFLYLFSVEKIDVFSGNNNFFNSIKTKFQQLNLENVKSSIFYRINVDRNVPTNKVLRQINRSNNDKCYFFASISYKEDYFEQLISKLDYELNKSDISIKAYRIKWNFSIEENERIDNFITDIGRYLFNDPVFNQEDLIMRCNKSPKDNFIIPVFIDHSLDTNELNVQFYNTFFIDLEQSINQYLNKNKKIIILININCENPNFPKIQEIEIKQFISRIIPNNHINTSFIGVIEEITAVDIENWISAVQISDNPAEIRDITKFFFNPVEPRLVNTDRQVTTFVNNLFSKTND